MTDPTPASDVRANPGEQVVDARIPNTSGCAALAMTAFDGLTTDDTFVLVADHDPIGIRYMLDAERAGQATWDALEEGPALWQARIRRVAAASA